MPPVPKECNAIAAVLASLQATDLVLRTKLATETGAEAWATLVALGQNRQQLSEQQAALDICIGDHSAALQANLVVIDLATPARCFLHSTHPQSRHRKASARSSPEFYPPARLKATGFTSPEIPRSAGPVSFVSRGAP
jgi:hypothetical protein